MIKTNGPEAATTRTRESHSLTFFSPVVGMISSNFLSLIGSMSGEGEMADRKRFSAYELEATNLKSMSGTVQMAFYKADVRLFLLTAFEDISLLFQIGMSLLGLFFYSNNTCDVLMSFDWVSVAVSSGTMCSEATKCIVIAQLDTRLVLRLSDLEHL